MGSSAEKDLAAPLAAAAAEVRALAPPGAAVAIVEARQKRFVNIGTERPEGGAVTSGTVFQIASLTKPFTAMVILRLAEQKRLGLSDAAAKWLPWLPAEYRAVTLRHLLNHTSGVPRDLRRGNVDEFTIDEFRRRFLEAKPAFAPGERWEYSNSGYTLLAMIAERASGREFGRLLEELIFSPGGMRHTRYRAPLVTAPGRALGRDWVEGRWTAAPPVYSGFGNSGIESTSADLAAFAVALNERRLLSAESYREMLSPAVLASGERVSFPFRGAPSSYGLGWFLADSCGAQVAAHGGTIAGFSANLSWVPQRRIAVAALSNGKSGPDRIGLADKIAGAALRSGLHCAE
jgi:CubicO group peptidase (beta-lactamase class C family)